MVPALAAARRAVPLVGARQRQLHGDRRARGARLRRAAVEDALLRELLPQAGFNSWRKGIEQAPFAFVIPERPGRPDARRAARVAAHGPGHRGAARDLGAHRSTEGSFPAGTYVVRLDQPYRNYAVDLLTPKFYPKDADRAVRRRLVGAAGPLPPRGVADGRCAAFATPPSAPLHGAAASDGRVSRRGPRLRARGYRARKVCSRRASGSRRFKLEIAEQPFKRGAARLSARLLDPRARSPDSRPRCARPPRSLALEFASLPAAAGARRRMRPRPTARQSGCPGPTPTASAGCATRSISATSPTPTCATRTSAPAICTADSTCSLYGHVDLELAEQIQGIPKAWGPMPFKKTAATPSFGTPAESDDITGGIGCEGLAELQRFVDGGGLLVTLGNGTHAGARGRHRARRAPRIGRRAAQLHGRRRRCRGRGAGRRDAHARRARARVALTARQHPIVYGYPARTVRVPAELCRSMRCRGAGCAWPIATPASTVRCDPRGVVTRVGRPGWSSRSWSAVRPGAKTI